MTGVSMTGVSMTGSGRQVPVLAGTQVLGGVAVASGVAVNGLLARQLTGSDALAGIAQTVGVLGAAACAVPLSRLAGARGRRPALVTGQLLGAAGGLASILAAVERSYPLLLLGAALFGGGVAAGLQGRYAAIDGMPADRRGRALSLVVWATTVGSVVGPNLSAPGASLADSIGLPVLAGPYLFSVTTFVAAAVVVWSLLRPDPLRPGGAGRPVGTVPAAATTGALAPARHRLRASMVAVGETPPARLGLVAVGTAHAVMVAVMMMTPVHLQNHGAGLDVVGFVISAHIAGMYALSPVFGALSDRFGRVVVIRIGLVALATATVLAGTAGDADHVRLGVALAVLGIGWSACVVGGSTLLSESVADDRRTGVQGLSDLVMGLAAAVAGALSGPVLGGPGYSVLNALAALLLVPVAVLVAVPGRRVVAVGN